MIICTTQQKPKWEENKRPSYSTDPWMLYLIIYNVQQDVLELEFTMCSLQYWVFSLAFGWMVCFCKQWVLPRQLPFTSEFHMAAPKLTYPILCPFIQREDSTHNSCDAMLDMIVVWQNEKESLKWKKKETLSWASVVTSSMISLNFV